MVPEIDFIWSEMNIRDRKTHQHSLLLHKNWHKYTKRDLRSIHNFAILLYRIKIGISLIHVLVMILYEIFIQRSEIVRCLLPILLLNMGKKHIRLFEISMKMIFSKTYFQNDAKREPHFSIYSYQKCKIMSLTPVSMFLIIRYIPHTHSIFLAYLNIPPMWQSRA